MTCGCRQEVEGLRIRVVDNNSNWNGAGLVAARDWAGQRRLVDVGGGHGGELPKEAEEVGRGTEKVLADNGDDSGSLVERIRRGFLKPEVGGGWF